MDFDPILPDDKSFVNKLDNFQGDKPPKKSVILTNKDSISILNLLNVATTHINDMEECRNDIKKATVILNDNLDKMSIKEVNEFLKIKIRELEIHAKALRDIYTIAMRTELAKQLLLGGSKDEKSIKNITPRVSGLITLLQKTVNKQV